MSCALLPAQAAVVHKWVDADGITHYSDQAPEPSTTQVTLIEVPETRSVKGNMNNDFYSIVNQWQRMHKERIEHEKLKLEQAKLKAAQQSATPQFVYINEPPAKQVVYAYPGAYYRRHNRSHYYKGHRHNSGYRHYRGKPPIGLHAGRLKLGSFKNVH